jgi:predicted ester cyclase
VENWSYDHRNRRDIPEMVGHITEVVSDITEMAGHITEIVGERTEISHILVTSSRKSFSVNQQLQASVHWILRK